MNLKTTAPKISIDDQSDQFVGQQPDVFRLKCTQYKCENELRLSKLRFVFLYQNFLCPITMVVTQKKHFDFVFIVYNSNTQRNDHLLLHRSFPSRAFHSKWWRNDRTTGVFSLILSLVRSLSFSSTHFIVFTFVRVRVSFAIFWTHDFSYNIHFSHRCLLALVLDWFKNTL